MNGNKMGDKCRVHTKFQRDTLVSQYPPTKNNTVIISQLAVIPPYTYIDQMTRFCV